MMYPQDPFCYEPPLEPTFPADVGQGQYVRDYTPQAGPRTIPPYGAADVYNPGMQEVKEHWTTWDNRYPGQKQGRGVYERPVFTQAQPYTQSLYTTPFDSTENRISTGVLYNPWTGQAYETFENQLPPGNTSKGEMPLYQLGQVSPQLLWLQGAYNNKNPPPRKKEHGADVFKPVSARGGANVFGDQLYTKDYLERMADMTKRQVFNNRNGDQVTEPSMPGEQPANMFGLQPRIQFMPYLPPTNQLVGSYVSNADTVGVDLRKREEYTGAVFNKKPHLAMINRGLAPGGVNGQMGAADFPTSLHKIDPQRSGWTQPVASPFADTGRLVPGENSPALRTDLGSLPVAGPSTVHEAPAASPTEIRLPATRPGPLPVAPMSATDGFLVMSDQPYAPLVWRPGALPVGLPEAAAQGNGLLPQTSTFRAEHDSTLPLAPVSPDVYGDALPFEHTTFRAEHDSTLPSAPVDVLFQGEYVVPESDLREVRELGSLPVGPAGLGDGGDVVVGNFRAPNRYENGTLPLAGIGVGDGGENVFVFAQQSEGGWRAANPFQAVHMGPSLERGGDYVPGENRDPTGHRGMARMEYVTSLDTIGEQRAMDVPNYKARKIEVMTPEVIPSLPVARPVGFDNVPDRGFRAARDAYVASQEMLSV